MCEKKNNNQKPVYEGYHEHGDIFERKTHFSVEPAAENEYDIELMTGHKLEGKDEK